MIKYILPLIFFLISCTRDEHIDNSSSENSVKSYDGTYALKDMDCSGTDIQYLTIDNNRISLFDYLGDECDDTVECYLVESFDIKESSIDTVLDFYSENVEISNGTIHLVSDSLILIFYDQDNGTVEHNWEKIEDEIYSFTPFCDQKYENTKDVVDIIAYAVSDEGNLLWEIYLNEGIWDIGTSIAQLSDGGYMIYGLFDAVNWGGCCYTKNAGMRDIIKLNDQGQEQWRRKLNYDDNTSLTWPPAAYIGKSLMQTSIGNLAVIAPGLDNIINVVMMDTSGNLIWTKNLPGIRSWDGYNDILETEDGDLALIAQTIPSVAFVLLDYYSGDILEQKEYEGLRYARSIVNVDDDFTILGTLTDPDSLNNKSIFLMKISSVGDEIWRKTWANDSTKIRQPMDLILTSDNGYLFFCNSDPSPYATLIKTDSEGNEQWRKRYDDYTSSEGWIHQTEDGGYFMASVYAVTKLDVDGNVEWSAAGSFSFAKYFNNGMVTAANKNMIKIDGGAVFTGYGSID